MYECWCSLIACRAEKTDSLMYFNSKIIAFGTVGQVVNNAGIHSLVGCCVEGL